MLGYSSGYQQARVLKDTGAHPRYHFYGFAGDQIAGDGKFFDRSPLGNHAVRGASLSDAQLFANAGYVSTVDPTGGTPDTVLRMPNLNFDYAGGEKLILWWLGKATPEGADARLLGDGRTATTRPGLSVRAKSTGKVDFYVYGAGGDSAASGISAVTVFDGTLHSFAIVLDGAAKKYAIWTDDTLEAAFGSNYLSFGSSVAYDLRNANTFNIGTSEPTTGTSYDGIASQTRAFHMLRLTATDTIPSVATLTAAFKQLRANPGKPILGSAF